MKTLPILFLLCLTVYVTTAQQAITDLSPNNRVEDITYGDGKIFISGDFDWYGEKEFGGLTIFDTELNHDSSYPTGYYARTAVSDGAGGWYIATYSALQHLKADKTIEDLPFTFDGGGYPIICMERIGNILYVGGQFTQVNSTARGYLAAIDLSNNTLTNWNPAANTYVYALDAVGTILYAGGRFSSIGGQTRSRIAAFDTSTGLVTSWNANVTTSSSYVYAIQADASNVYFGGSFANVASGVPSRTNFAAVNTTTGALTSFNPRPNDDILTLLLDGNTLYLAGDFDQIASTAKNGFAALNVTTGLPTTFATTLNENTGRGFIVNALAIDGQKLFIGGSFLTTNGTERARLAVVDKTTGTLEPMSDIALSGDILTLSVSGGKILAGGSFAGSTNALSTTKGILALDENTGNVIDWTADVIQPAGNYIYDMKVYYRSQRVYYQGRLSGGGSSIGALNSSDGSGVDTWNVTVDGRIHAWTFSDDALYLAGEFTTVNGISRNGVAAVNLTTGAVLPFTIGFEPDFSSDYVYSMIAKNNLLYVAGDFEYTDGSESRTNLAAWSTQTGDLSDWNPDGTDIDNVNAATSSHVYLTTHNNFFRVDALTGERDENWTADVGESVETVFIQGNYVYAGGWFSPGIARLSISTGATSGIQPEINDVYDVEGSVRVIAGSATKLFVGGNFDYPTQTGEGAYFAIFEITEGIPNLPPQIEAVTTAVPIQGIVTINLEPLISDPDDNLDPNSLYMVDATSEQGALPTLEQGSFMLVLDYGGVLFQGTDRITIGACDLLGECTEQQLIIEVGSDIFVYNAVSANGDSRNDRFRIANIEAFQNNKVTIFNRWGDLVFEMTDYNNEDRVFTGLNKNNKELPAGTYFYKVEFSGKTKTGYLSLKR